MRYLPNEARREAEAAIAAAQEEAQHQRSAAEDSSRRCDLAERRAQDAETEAARKVREAEWTFSQETVGYQLRIAALEQLLEDERREHASELQHREEVLRASQDAADLRVRHVEDRCTASVAAAEARAKEAEEAADSTRRNAAAEVAAARAREEVRVREARRESAASLQESEQRRRRELEQLRAEVAAERKSMEAALSAARRQQGRALGEAERRVAERDHNVGEWTALKELDISRKEASLEAWAKAKQGHAAASEDHHKDMLTLERDMHKRTMERTLDRVARHLTCDDKAQAGGRDTPTREVLEATGLPEGLPDAPAPVGAPAAAVPGEGDGAGFDGLIQAVLRQREAEIAAYPGDLDERGRYSGDEEWPVALPPGYTALGVAAAFGKRRSVEALLKAGADPRGRDELGAYPQAIAHAAGQPEIAELIRTWPLLPHALGQTWLAPAAPPRPRSGAVRPPDEDCAGEAADVVPELPSACL